MEIEAILDRIETGMTTVEDAKAVARLVGRVMRYELVLKDIAVHGDDGAAMKACEALAQPSPQAPLPMGEGRH